MIKVLVSVAMLAGFVWFGMTVELGERTLFQHVSAIANSQESEQLVRGTKQTVTGLFDGKEADKADAIKKAPVVIKERPSEKTGARVATTTPQDGLTGADRQGMRKLIGSRRPPSEPAKK